MGSLLLRQEAPQLTRHAFSPTKSKQKFGYFAAAARPLMSAATAAQNRVVNRCVISCNFQKPHSSVVFLADQKLDIIYRISILFVFFFSPKKCFVVFLCFDIFESESFRGKKGKNTRRRRRNLMHFSFHQMIPGFKIAFKTVHNSLWWIRNGIAGKNYRSWGN